MTLVVYTHYTTHAEIYMNIEYNTQDFKKILRSQNIE